MAQVEGMIESPRRNRGPSVAAANKKAIIAAARKLFAERGYRVPLSTIAREASVSQGVFYRHFPTRQSLALVVFEDNFSELRLLAASPATDALWPFWARILELTVSDVAFVELALETRDSIESAHAGDELRRLLTPLLSRAQDAGLVASVATIDDVLLTQRMLYGIALTAREGEEPGDHIRQLMDSLRSQH